MFFQHFPPRHRSFASRVIFMSNASLKTIFNARTRSQHAPTPASSHIHLFPPSGHPPSLLVVKFTPPSSAVILRSFWRSNSPLPAQRSSSGPSGGQIHPSLFSGHPPTLLAVKLTTLRPAVILRPFCWSISPLSTRGSTSTSPTGGQLHPSYWCCKGRGVKRGNERR